VEYFVGEGNSSTKAFTAQVLDSSWFLMEPKVRC
jgi:hypothetical protein